jgi:hypothetical protein
MKKYLAKMKKYLKNGIVDKKYYVYLCNPFWRLNPKTVLRDKLIFKNKKENAYNSAIS